MEPLTPDELSRDLDADLKHVSPIGENIHTCFKAWEIAIKRAKAAEAEVERLRSMVEGLAARVAAQSELLSRKAEDKP